MRVRANPLWGMLPALLAAGLCAPVGVLAQDAETRMQQLEEQLRALTQELDALKQQVREQRTAQPTPDQQTLDADLKKAQAEAAAAAATAADAKEKAVAAEQRLEQNTLQRLPDGVGWQDPRGRWSARLQGRLQLDYRTYDPEGMLANTFAIRRARLGLQVVFLSDYVFRVEGEYASGNGAVGPQGVAATHVYMGVNWLSPYARIILGQTKPQFGLENTASANFSDFLERGLTQNLIGSLNYDRGIFFDGAPFTGFNYGVSITNGTGLNTNERQGNAQEAQADGKMLTVRVSENFAALAKLEESVIHIGYDYKQGIAANSPASPFPAATGTTEALGLTFFTPQAFNAATGASASNVERSWNDFELALAHGPLKLQGEYMTVNYQGTRNAPAPVVNYSLDIDAYYVNLMWMITGEAYADSYKDGQFGRIRPRNNFDWKNRTWGGWELGLRYSVFDASDFGPGKPAFAGALATTSPVTQSTNEATAWTVGLKWLPNAYTRFMLNYIRTDFETPVIANSITTSNETAVTLRGQFDF